MNLYEEQIKKIAAEDQLWSMLDGKRIMISGATGMVGKCLIDIIARRNVQIEKQIEVIALGREENKAKRRLGNYWNSPFFKYICCDVNQEIPEAGIVDYVIHAASNTHPLQYSSDPIGTITANVIGTKNLLDYAVCHQTKKFCFLSSVEIYGENQGTYEQFQEKDLGYIDCNTLRAGYPESKRLGETLCNAYGKSQGLFFVIPRLCRTYGPTMLDSDSKAISQFMKKAAAGENIILKSEGLQKYSYCFVTDIASGILYILSYGENGEAYNIADTDSDITLRELAEKLAKVAGTEVVFELPDKVEKQGYSTATKAMLNANKLKSLGWKPAVHMADGIQCTVEEMRDRIACKE